MSIQELRIQGFRSLRDVVWTPGKLNILIGPNGSGKSNLLRAVELLRIAAGGSLRDAVLWQGGMAALLWDHQVEDLSWDLRADMPAFADDESRYDYHLVLRQLKASSSTYRVEREVLAHALRDLPLEARTTLERGPASARAYFPEKREFIDYSSDVTEDETLLSQLARPLVDPWVTSFRNRLSQWSIYHDLRVDQDAPLRQAAVARLETQIAPDGQNLIPVLHTLYTGNRDFKQTADAALRVAFGQDYEELTFPPAADQRVQLRLRLKSLKTAISAAELSDGTLRFLLLLVILAQPEPGDFLAIDEPETGLHPAMFPILAELAVEAAERTQVVFSTHSPQFLDAFRGETPTTTVTAWREGQTHLAVLDGEELKRWLRDFSLGSLYQSGELEGLA
jgi:predicted ATPase